MPYSDISGVLTRVGLLPGGAWKCVYFAMDKQITDMNAVKSAETGTGIKVDALTKTFHLEDSTVRALDDLTLIAPYKKVLTLLGPSGCGKTTLLRSIAGLEVPDTGTIQIGDKIVFSSAQKVFLPPNKRNISMVFQSYAIWPHMTVFGNVAYPLEVQKIPRTEIKKRVRKTLAQVQLEGFEDRPATKLSGGQQQRVALARALVAEPSVLLFDEPLSNLDAKLREEARKELRIFLTELGVSSIYVTHDRMEALTISDAIAVMDAGQIVEIGAPLEIYYRSSHKFVVSFVGDVNFVDAEVIGKTGDLTLVRSPLGEVACRADQDIPNGSTGVLSMRPEIFQLLPDDSDQRQNVLHCRVEHLLFTGETYEADIAVGEVRLSVKLSSYADVQEGQTISLFADPERCRFISEQ